MLPCLPAAPAGKLALDYFHQRCPSLPGLREGENEAEWLVDLTTQARGSGRCALCALPLGR